MLPHPRASSGGPEVGTRRGEPCLRSHCRARVSLPEDTCLRMGLPRGWHRGSAGGTRGREKGNDGASRLGLHSRQRRPLPEGMQTRHCTPHDPDAGNRPTAPDPCGMLLWALALGSLWPFLQMSSDGPRHAGSCWCGRDCLSATTRWAEGSGHSVSRSGLRDGSLHTCVLDSSQVPPERVR